jgi:hypothetical protein
MDEFCPFCQLDSAGNHRFGCPNFRNKNILYNEIPGVIKDYKIQDYDHWILEGKIGQLEERLDNLEKEFKDFKNALKP